MRGVVAAAALALAFGGPLPAVAQDQGQTLADIRQELAVLYVELQRLKRELVTTGAPGVPLTGSTTLERVDAIEAQLTRLTGRAEELTNRIDQVVSDGTNRLGDLEFRVCELEPGCNPGEVGDTLPIGGVAVGAPAAPAPEAGAGAQLALGEQADFDAARAAYDAGEYQRAADLFAAFTQSYTGGPLTGEAHYWRGQALERAGLRDEAARAYLESFSGSPNGALAPDALLRLGLSIEAQGNRAEACLTLGEVTTRFPQSQASIGAQAARASLGCN